MDKIIKWGVICVFLIKGNMVYSEELQSIQAFGKTKVGDVVPSFSGVSETGKKVSSTTPEGKFFMYFINDQLPPICLDEECGKEATHIVMKEGHFIGGGDGKYAKIFDVQLISTTPWKFNASLMIVANCKREILAIYKNAHLTHIEKIIIDLRL